MVLARLVCVLLFSAFLLTPGRPYSADTDIGTIDSEDQLQVDHAIVKIHLGSVSKHKASAIVIFEIQSGWHIYAKDPGDTGMPTRMWFENLSFSNLNIHWPRSSKSFDKVGNKVLKSNIYGGVVAFPITFKIEDTAKNSDVAQLHVSFALCGELCIPKKLVLDVDIPSDEFENREILDLIKKWKRK